MTRARIAVCLLAFGFVAASATPAMAEDGQSRVCIILTNDRNNPGSSPLCVWVPVEKGS